MKLTIRNLSVFLGHKQILSSINLDIFSGKIHALMGPNGSGKSTLAGAVMGSDQLKIENARLPARQGKLKIGEKNILTLKPDERARLGIFLAFQNPVGIPGVSVANLLRTAYQVNKQSNNRTIEQSKTLHNPALSVWKFNEILLDKAQTLAIPQDFLRRSLNEQFSGGEKKKLEILQALVLEPKFAIFDEIDTGLDVDALKTVALGIKSLKDQGCGVLLITHYQRIFKYVQPDFVHVLVNGRIVASGSEKLAREIEEKGYKQFI